MMKTEQEQIKAMTKDEIKKAFAICCGVQDCTGCPILDMEKQNGHGCKFNLFTRVIDTVSEQEKEIERLKAEKKQAKIDVLNKLKERIKTAIDTYFNLDGGGYYLAEGALDDIDELIEEVEK